jgi:DUF4097 and DUF4098 domain-containing protein YvlB
MVANPPPYSQRDAVRAQRRAERAQRAAERAQRQYWRATRRPSIIGPLLLLAVGVVALMVELGQLSAFQLWDWYARWWPLLLILVGLISLGEWWWDRDNPYGRRHHYGGVVGLLILLAVIGSANRGFREFHHFDTWGSPDWFYGILGHQHESDFTLNREMPSGALLDIQVPHGDVTLTPSGDSEIHVQSHATVYTTSDSDARRAFDKIQPQLTVDGKSVTLRTTDQNNARTDLTIEIPADAIASLTVRRGDVTAEDLKTAFTVTSNEGDVKLTNLKAAADVHMRKGDFDAHTIGGDVSLEGRLDDVAITDVDGRVLLNGDFFGDTHVAHVSSQVHYRSTRTGIELASLPGDLTLDSDDLQVDNALGPVTITTRSKDVACTQIAGNAHLEDNNGEISLSTAGQPGTIQIENHNGRINLNLPANASFTLQAVARNGEIHSEFDLPVTLKGSGQSASGTVGKGDAKIDLTADHGSIAIAKFDSSAPPGPPTPLTPPMPPRLPSPPSTGKAPRHLRAPADGVPRAQTQ